MNNFSEFEKEIQETYQLPQPSPTFIRSLEMEIKTHQQLDEKKSRSIFQQSRGWVYAAITIFLLLATLLLTIGPSKVLAQIQAILGYVPGVGIVESDASFYSLIEPISDTREGITIGIESALFSKDKTVIQFRTNEIPDEMKTESFGQPECRTPAFLIFPDGNIVHSSRHNSMRESKGTFINTLQFYDLGIKDFRNATLVLPCLNGTAINKGPQDWQFDIALEPASDDINFYPLDMVKSTEIENTKKTPIEFPAQASQETETNPMPEMIIDGDRHEEMVVLSVVEKPDSYWVTWAFHVSRDPFDDVSISGENIILPPSEGILYDSKGEIIPPRGGGMWADFQQDLLRQLPEEDQAKYYILASVKTFAVPKSGVEFPVYMKVNAIERSIPEKENYVDIEFDGSLIQSEDQPVVFDQDLEIGDIKFKLRSIYIDMWGAYAFKFDGSEGNVIECELEILGHDRTYGGYFGAAISGERIFFEQSLMFTPLPSGPLTVRISHPAVKGDTVTYIGSWSPED
jgi:hypothetical protein